MITVNVKQLRLGEDYYQIYPTSVEYEKKLEEDKDREERLKKAAEIISNAFK